MVIHGQLDEAFILEENSSQHLFFMGLDGYLLYHAHSTYGLNMLAIPFYNGGIESTNNDYFFILLGSPMMFLPVVSLGYIARWQINPNFEINFNAFTSSPNAGISLLSLPLFSIYQVNIFGPGVSVGIGFKRRISKSENSPLSYKFNLGIDYTGDLHGAISIKNSILIGIQRQNSILSLNPFINFALKVGLISMNGGGSWVVLEPGFELTSKIVSKNNFVFISTFMVGYETDFLVIGADFLYMGKIIVSASFGIGKIVVTNK